MPNILKESNDPVGFVLRDPVTTNETPATMAAATTYKAGTIMARDSVSLKWIPFVKGGSTNQNGIAKGILMHELVTVGAGDYPVSVGVGGIYRLSKLVIHADGNATNIDGAVKDGLRDYGVTVLPTTNLMQGDN